MDLLEVKKVIEDTMGEYVKKINDKVDFLASMGENKLWKEDFGEKIKALANSEIKRLFFSSDTEKTKAISTSTVAGVIPSQWVSHIFDTIPDYGAIFQAGAYRTPLSQTIYAGKLGDDVAMYWQTQNEAPTGSSPTIPAISVSAQTLIGTLQMANQTLKYSNQDLTDYFTRRFTYKLASKIDDESFNGTGSGNYKFTGILKATGCNVVQFATGKTAFTDITNDDIIKAKRSIPSTHLGKAGWFMSNSVLGILERKLTDTTGRPLYDLSSGKLAGYPVYLTNALPSEGDSAANTPFIVFGVVPEGLMFSFDNINIDVSTEAGFISNSTYLRVVADVAIYVALPSLFCIIKTGTTT